MAPPRPTDMRRLLLTLPALVLPGLVLAGCGEDGAPAPESRTASPPASSPASPPGDKAGGDTVMAPAWPPPGCREVVVAARSYAENAVGEASPEEAALAAVDEGARAIRGTEPGGADKRTWYVVAADGTGVAAVEVFPDAAGTGWLAASVERCADPAAY